MNVEFVGRHYEIEDRVKGYAEERLAASERFADEPIHAHVAFTREGYRCIADLQFSHRGGRLHATESADDMFDATNMAFDKLDKQLRRANKRRVDRRRRADHKRVEGDRWPVEVVGGDQLRAGETEVLRSSSFEIREMDMNAAVAQLETSKNQFLIFRHSATGQTTVLYKRKDGDYGVVSPDA